MTSRAISWEGKGVIYLEEIYKSACVKEAEKLGKMLGKDESEPIVLFFCCFVLILFEVL